MNISAITPNFFIKRLNNNSNTNTQNYKSNLTPLTQDTVSFQVGEKTLKDGAKRLSKKTGMEINKALEKPFNKFVHRLHDAFGDLIASEKNPEGPIARISCRIKSPESIAEKGGSRECKNVIELTEKIQDLMGGRLEMRDPSRDSIQKVIDILEEMVKKGIFNITEIESYYAEPNLAYITNKMIKSLVKTCRSRNNIRVVQTEHPAGYHGVHVTVRMPKDCDNAYAEIQIMDEYSAMIKYANDPAYKVENNKGVQKKYAPVAKIFAPLKSDNETLKNAYKEYTRQAYIQQRKKKPREFGEEIKPDFLDIPWFLPQELDYKNIYKEMKKCDLAAEKAAKAAKAAKVSTKPVVDVKDEIRVIKKVPKKINKNAKDSKLKSGSLDING